jgi:hypothetical protein
VAGPTTLCSCTLTPVDQLRPAASLAQEATPVMIERSHTRRVVQSQEITTGAQAISFNLRSPLRPLQPQHAVTKLDLARGSPPAAMGMM